MSIFALLCFVFFSFALLIFDFVMEAVSAGFVVDLRDKYCKAAVALLFAYIFH